MMSWQLPLLFATLFASTFAVGFELNPGESQCFLEYAAKGSAVTTIFQVTHGGYLDVDVQAYSPDGRVLYSGSRESSGKFSFMAQTDGKFKFCFGNLMSTVSKKILTMDILVRNKSEEPKKDQVIDSLSEQLKILVQTSKEMTLDVKYLNAREVAHTSTVENTKNRVYNWAMFEIITLIIMTFFQMFYLRAFFEGRNVI